MDSSSKPRLKSMSSSVRWPSLSLSLQKLMAMIQSASACGSFLAILRILVLRQRPLDRRA